MVMYQRALGDNTGTVDVSDVSFPVFSGRHGDSRPRGYQAQCICFHPPLLFDRHLDHDDIWDVQVWLKRKGDQGLLDLPKGKIDWPANRNDWESMDGEGSESEDMDVIEDAPIRTHFLEMRNVRWEINDPNPPGHNLVTTRQVQMYPRLHFTDPIPYEDKVSIQVSRLNALSMTIHINSHFWNEDADIERKGSLFLHMLNRNGKWFLPFQ